MFQNVFVNITWLYDSVVTLRNSFRKDESDRRQSTGNLVKKSDDETHIITKRRTVSDVITNSSILDSMKNF